MRTVLNVAGAEERLAEIAERVRDVALVDYLRRIGGVLDRVLGETETLLCGREMNVGEFADVLADGWTPRKFR